MTNPFEIAVPNDELDRPDFEPMPTGEYFSTLQPGTEKASNDGGWEAIRLPFKGFRAKDGSADFENRERAAQFTIANPGSPQAVEIGVKGLIAAAQAFGLTEETTVDGKPAQRLTATNYEELIDQFNSVAGTEVEVYVKVKRRKKNKQVVLKDDGSAVLDNEIARISALTPATA